MDNQYAMGIHNNNSLSARLQSATHWEGNQVRTPTYRWLARSYHLLLLDLMNWIICAVAAPFRFVLPHRKASNLH